MLVDTHPQARAFPLAEVMVDGRPRRKVLRQIAPLASGLVEVKDRVEQLPVAVLARTACFAGLGKAIVDELPFGFGQVRSVAHPQRTRAGGQKNTAISA